MNSATGTLTLIVIALVSGCYTYRPLANAEPETGTRISAELTDEGARELSGTIGPGIEHVEGEVLSVDSTAIKLSVRQVQAVLGWQTDWSGEPVTIPRTAVAGLQERRLSVGGTGFVSGVVIGGVYAVYRLLGGTAIFEGGGRSGSGQSQ
jgi:hypothetical protein